MSPKVSVIIPVFNRPLAVCRSIESVLAQTRQDFEIIVVDDASSDSTAQVVTALADPRITLIRHQRNRGGSAARNTGIRASSAPYVAFLDSDDEWMPTKLEQQLGVFERSSDRLGIVYAGAERVFADGSVSRSIPRRQPQLARALLTANVIGETSVGMVRRSALQETGGFDESLPSSQEMDLWLRICERFDADFVPAVLVRVAKGDDSGRISANIVATTSGRELFRRKHRDKMVHYGVLHLHLRENGWWYLRGARDLKQARRCGLEALVAKPWAPTTYVFLLLTWLPLSWQDRLAGWRGQVISWLRSRSSSWGFWVRASTANPAQGTETSDS